jgi:hypothetical protein
MNVLKIANEILAKEVVPGPDLPEDQVPKDETVVTTVPQEQVDEATTLAMELRDIVENLTTEVDMAIESLSGSSSPSVLESQDDFKKLMLKLKAMKKKLTLV